MQDDPYRTAQMLWAMYLMGGSGTIDAVERKIDAFTLEDEVSVLEIETNIRNSVGDGRTTSGD